MALCDVVVEEESGAMLRGKEVRGKNRVHKQVVEIWVVISEKSRCTIYGEFGWKKVEEQWHMEGQ